MAEATDTSVDRPSPSHLAEAPPVQVDIDVDTFCIYRTSRLMWMLSSRGVTLVQAFALYLVVLLAGKMLVCQVAGVLVSPNLLDQIAADVSHGPFAFMAPVGRFMFGNPTTIEIFRWLTKTLSANGPYAEASSTAVRTGALVPYLRDYVDMAMMVLLSMSLALTHRHWKRISEAPILLAKNGIIAGGELDRAAFAAMLKKWDAEFARPRWRVISLAIAVLALAALYLGVFLGVRAIYAIYWSPESGVGMLDFQRSAFEWWWARPRGFVGWLPLLYHFGTLLFGLYFVVLGNIFGAKVVEMLKDFLGKVEERPERVSLCPGHPDGCAGLRPIRRILDYVFANIFILAVSVFVMPFYLPAPSEGLPPVIGLIPFMVLLVVVAPYLAARPLRELDPLMEQYRDKNVTRIIRSMQEMRDELQAAQIKRADAVNRWMAHYQALKDELALYQEMPVGIYSRRSMASASFAVLSLVMAMIQVVFAAVGPLVK